MVVMASLSFIYGAGGVEECGARGSYRLSTSQFTARHEDLSENRS